MEPKKNKYLYNYLWQPPKLNLKDVPSLIRRGTIPQTEREQDG